MLIIGCHYLPDERRGVDNPNCVLGGRGSGNAGRTFASKNDLRVKKNQNLVWLRQNETKQKRISR